jgi:hypothetical protein
MSWNGSGVMTMTVYQYNDLTAVERELGLLLFCWDYWKKEIRKEIEDAVSAARGDKKLMSLDKWVRELLYELNEKRRSRYSGHSRRR